MGISTHILDMAVGRPAASVPVTLCIAQQADWIELACAITDVDGRCRSLLPEGHPLVAGIYRIRFETAAYYVTRQMQGLYPFVDVTFTVTDAAEHFHIPLLLTANGYTTYRGS